MSKWYVTIESHHSGISDQLGEFITRWTKFHFFDGSDQGFIEFLKANELIDDDYEIDITCLEPDGSERRINFS